MQFKNKIFLVLTIAFISIGIFPFINTIKKIKADTDIEILSNNYSKLNSILLNQKKVVFYTNIPDSLGGIEWYYKSQLILAPTVLVKKPYQSSGIKLCLLFNNYPSPIIETDSILYSIKSIDYSVIVIQKNL
jgi:hypothetical protein